MQLKNQQRVRAWDDLFLHFSFFFSQIVESKIASPAEWTITAPLAIYYFQLTL